LRDVPIITLSNKLDREGCEPFDSYIAMLIILKLPHSHAIFRDGRGREWAVLERLMCTDSPDTG
jgi:peptide subunit release factor RF-3